jgi:RNA polymerase subunit RPABC4/transcription elongation factor Spt4
MTDLVKTFKEKAETLVSAIDRKGGVRATLESLRRQMAESDRRRAIHNVRAELRRIQQQIEEMINAVGVQAVGLYEAGKLTSPELQPLCQHIVQLKAAVAQQEAELAKLEASAAGSSALGAKLCIACGKPLPDKATFCPYCGTASPKAMAKRFCTNCGSALRFEAKFCAKCGQAVQDLP